MYSRTVLLAIYLLMVSMISMGHLSIDFATRRSPRWRDCSEKPSIMLGLAVATLPRYDPGSYSGYAATTSTGTPLSAALPDSASRRRSSVRSLALAPG